MAILSLVRLKCFLEICVFFGEWNPWVIYLTFHFGEHLWLLVYLGVYVLRRILKPPQLITDPLQHLIYFLIIFVKLSQKWLFFSGKLAVVGFFVTFATLFKANSFTTFKILLLPGIKFFQLLSILILKYLLQQLQILHRFIKPFLLFLNFLFIVFSLFIIFLKFGL